MSSPRRALLSVSDKSGLVELARALSSAGYELVSTGGTFKVLTEAGLSVRYVSEVTEHPEVFGGRVKTLHPRIHGGILYRRDVEQDSREAESNGIVPIDVVVVNLYPFQQTVARDGVSQDEAIEQIDIGGPAMVRAAAKNFAAVSVIVSPERYGEVIERLQSGQTLDLDYRRGLALEAFRHTAAYDAAIATWLTKQAEGASSLPSERNEAFERSLSLRYGENPHQGAALYHSQGDAPLAGGEVLQGKALSYNNLLDLDAAIGAVLEHQDPACVVIKHTNPCGVGRSEISLAEAWTQALQADPISAFGGIVAFNREVDSEVAQGLKPRFLEVVAAPSFSAQALELLSSKKNLRLVTYDEAQLQRELSIRSTTLGLLVQQADPCIDDLGETFEVVTERAPSADEEQALAFLWRVCKHVKSNAIVIGGAGRTYGVGAGQMSRVDAVELAVKKATAELDGACLASDAFFPFRDGVDAAAKAGVKAIIQPGGSKRDPEVIAACNELGITMVFTGNRHFRH